VSPSLRLGKAIRHYRGEAIVVALALLLWLPRLSGPIDLRWDAGVYYVLGTSLASGHGYRILSEPGSPEALQYPPLLPGVVALQQWALGTTNPDVVAPWLRKSYAALFVAYSVAVLALARRHLQPAFAVTATALCLLQVWTIYLSDLLYAEVPYALVSIVFALVAVDGALPSRPWLREAASFSLAAGGFLLRTAGIALLAAWILEASARRRWRLAVVRSVLALLPILAWQAYVVRVRTSDAYIQPAYEYQRAPYLYYNVSYADNALLIDSSRPELGRIDTKAFATRLMTNVPSMVLGLGETVSTERYYWTQALNHVQQRLLGRTVFSNRVVLIPILILGCLVVVGLVGLIRRGANLIALMVLISIGLIWTTPWPLQFPRYLAPLAPFLAIAAMLSFSQFNAVRRTLSRGRASVVFGRVAVAGLLLLMLIPQVYTLCQVFYQRDRQGASFVPGRGATGPHFFYHDRFWRDWEEVIAWIQEHSTPDAVIATPASHLCYLFTGRRAVSPPLESGLERARQLLESVPVSYVVVDQFGFSDVSRRYARPTVESDPARWHLVYSVNNTTVYERTGDPQ
jgi:hypothetical protein